MEPLVVVESLFVPNKEVWILSWRRFLSFRNQSFDLLCKSMDWFLYDRNLRHERVKEMINLWCMVQLKTRRFQENSLFKNKWLCRTSCCYIKFGLVFVRDHDYSMFLSNACVVSTAFSYSNLKLSFLYLW